MMNVVSITSWNGLIHMRTEVRKGSSGVVNVWGGREAWHLCFVAVHQALILLHGALHLLHLRLGQRELLLQCI